MRYRYHFWTATRATSKSFTAYLSAMVRAVLLPGSVIMIASDTKGTVKESKFSSILNDYINANKENDISKLIDFRLEANVNTYAAYSNEVAATRLNSHDFSYSSGPYTYHDTYVGGEQFAGEEAIWLDGKIQYAMNYMGRVLDQQFSGDFLKEALRNADKKMPYRGPEFYVSGEYTYKCSVTGDFTWFQGCEEICCNNVKVYECYFHGGLMK